MRTMALKLLRTISGNWFCRWRKWWQRWFGLCFIYIFALTLCWCSLEIATTMVMKAWCTGWINAISSMFSCFRLCYSFWFISSLFFSTLFSPVLSLFLLCTTSLSLLYSPPVFLSNLPSVISVFYFSLPPFFFCPYSLSSSSSVQSLLWLL